MKKSSEEFENFDRTMRDLMSVPHEEIKAALEAEKEEKRNRKGKRSEEKKNSRADQSDLPP